MKYQCKEGHTFLFPLTRHEGKDENNWVETKHCPFCMTANYEEYTEAQPDITSVKSVDLSQVDDYLKLGYTVKELYAKTATLVKLEVKS